MRHVLLAVFFASLLFSSCRSIPTNEGASSASSVGDRAFRIFDETVASIQFPDASGGLRNLHVELAAVLGSSASSSSSSSSTYLYPRIVEVGGLNHVAPIDAYRHDAQRNPPSWSDLS
jgi:hypothetical protein